LIVVMIPLLVIGFIITNYIILPKTKSKFLPNSFALGLNYASLCTRQFKFRQSISANYKFVYYNVIETING